MRHSLLIAAVVCSLPLSAAGQSFERVDTGGTQWFRGNTHTHTTASDGDSPPEVVAQWYKDHGYRFLVLSDHNVFTDPEWLHQVVDSTFILIGGEEVTSGFDSKPVHVNGLNIDRVIAPRRSATLVGTIQNNVDAVRDGDGVPHINHPNYGWAFGAEELLQIRDDRLIEIFNGHPYVHNEGGGGSPSMEEVWDELLTAGKRMYGIAVDDAHHFQGEFARNRSNPGRGWISVRASSLDAEEIMRNLERGLFYASTGVELEDVEVGESHITIRIRQARDFRYTTTFIGDGGRELGWVAGTTATLRLEDVSGLAGLTYVRARVDDSGGARAWIQPVFLEREEPATGTGGMVSSAHPLATDAGIAILQAGGNAFDAAVAIAAALNVVEPMMSGMGGYGTILIYSAEDRRSWFLNSSGRIPSGLDSDAFRAPTPDYLQNRRGAKAVSTPGNVNAWEAMWERYGSREWSTLFGAAIGLAENGFEIDARTAGLIANAFPRFPDHAKAFYGQGNRPLQAGERLVQTDLARSFRMVAEQGAAAVHGGELGRAIDRAMREAGGFLTLQDLAENEAEWWEPVSIDYRGHRIVTASPPANSWPALVRLGLMSRYDVPALGHNTPDYLHTFAEVTKHGFWTRLRWAGDPDVQPPPLDRLLSEAYWDSVTATIDPARATSFTAPTFFGADGHTTHFVVADRWGNVVSATQTLGNSFGSRIMAEGTGIWLNNSLAYSTFEPKGNPMDAFPGRHKLSGDVPLFVMDGDRVRVAIGTPGGHTIAQNVPQMVMNIIDFGMDIQRAIAAPRVSFTEPNFLAVEETVPESVRSALEARGHVVRVVRGIGNAHGLVIQYDAAGRPVRFQGGADPRGGGKARGY